MKRIRAICERLPDFRERFPEVAAALRDTAVPAWSRLKRAWRIVNRVLLDRPEWLSSRTEPLRDIRFRRRRGERTSLAENFHRRLHGLHTIGRSSILGAGVFAATVALAVSLGAALADAEVPNRVSALGGTLVTVAEVLGGAAGILFAVIVFGIQFHGERLDKAAFLVRYLRRREGLIPIAAFTLAVVAANVVVSLLCSLGLPHAAVPMAVLDVPLVPLVLWFVLWLLYRMAVSVSEDLVTLLTPSLTWEYDRALDEDIHHSRQIKVFEETIEGAGLEYSTVGGFTSLDRVTPVKLNMTGCGSVTDVNLAALKTLGEYVRFACPDHDAKLCVGPGDSVDNTVALVLSATRDDQGRQKQDVVAPSEEVVGKLQRKLRAVYRIGASPERDVVGVLSRFEEALVGYARRGFAEQLEQGLEIQETLVKRGLSRPDAVPTSFSIHRERLPDFLAGFSYFDMAKATVASGDQQKVSALLMFACRMMIAAIGHKHPGLYHRAGQIIEAVYFGAIQRTALADYVGETVDVALSTIGAQFEYAHSSWRLNPPKTAEQMPVLIVDLGWRLRLIKTAMEAGRTTDATNFQDRLFRWDKHSGKRHADPQEEESVPPKLREACDLMSYATLIVAAWCLHLVEQNHKHADTAKAVFQKCASDLGAREHLVRLWEAVRARSYSDTHIEGFFGTTHWTLPSPHRAGVSVFGWGGDAWIRRGFIALLLERPSVPKYERPIALDTTPPFRPDALDEVRTLANAIFANETVRTGLLNIADDKRDGTVDAVVSLFSDRLRLFKLDRLTAVVSSPLRDEHRTRLHAQIAKALGSRHGIIEMLNKLGGLQSNAHSWFLPRINYEVWLPKEGVLACDERQADFAPLIASSVQNLEDTRIVHAAERIAEPTKTIESLAELPDAVRDAVLRLRQTARNPILLFVPRERRIIEALVGGPAWQLPNRRALGDHHLGEWGGCQLAQFPYLDPSSVVILAPLAFYGKVEEDAAARLDFHIDHPQKRQHDEWVQQGQSETDPTKIRETGEVTVLAVARFALSVGLNEHGAALRVDLDLSRIGYALVRGQDVYHRPGCASLAQTQDGIVYSLAHGLPSDTAGRMPCEHCHPDRWEAEPALAPQDALIVG